MRVELLRCLIGHHDREVVRLDRAIHLRRRDDVGYRTIQHLDGIGPVFVAEIGDISRFRSPKQLVSWAGLTPNHRKSDTTVIRGSITTQGSPSTEGT